MMDNTSATDDIIAMCEQLRHVIDAMRTGEIRVRIQDGRLLTFTPAPEYRRGYEIKINDLILDNRTTVVYNPVDMDVTRRKPLDF